MRLALICCQSLPTLIQALFFPSCTLCFSLRKTVLHEWYTILHIICAGKERITTVIAFLEFQYSVYFYESLWDKKIIISNYKEIKLLKRMHSNCAHKRHTRYLSLAQTHLKNHQNAIINSALWSSLSDRRTVPCVPLEW